MPITENNGGVDVLNSGKAFASILQDIGILVEIWDIYYT